MRVLVSCLLALFVLITDPTSERFLTHTSGIVWNHHDYHTIGIVEERDKATHRSNFASISYNITHAEQKFYVQAFPKAEGGRDLDANFFADFEDWEAGTFGWTIDGEIQRPERTEGAHFNSFDFPLLGRLELLTTHELLFNTSTYVLLLRL